jgi:hypothetical protein
MSDTYYTVVVDGITKNTCSTRQEAMQVLKNLQWEVMTAAKLPLPGNEIKQVSDYRWQVIEHRK